MVLLNRAYGGYAAGTIVELAADTESALIAQGLAVTSAGPATSGAVTTSELKGSVTFAAAAASVVVTHASCTAASRVLAYVSQAAADTTLLRIERIVTAAGSFTLHGTAAATAATVVEWQLFP
jgi:hypothetical protein